MDQSIHPDRLSRIKDEYIAKYLLKFDSVGWYIRESPRNTVWLPCNAGDICPEYPHWKASLHYQSGSQLLAVPIFESSQYASNTTQLLIPILIEKWNLDIQSNSNSWRVTATSCERQVLSHGHSWLEMFSRLAVRIVLIENRICASCEKETNEFNDNDLICSSCKPVGIVYKSLLGES